MNEIPRRWRGKAANLVVVGAAGTLMSTTLGGCSDRSTFHRNVYASEKDCAVDYAASECARNGTHVSTKQFLGPVYRMNAGRAAPCRGDDPGPGRVGLGIGGLTARTGVANVERGGFGTHCTSRSSSSRTTRRWGWGG